MGLFSFFSQWRKTYREAYEKSPNFQHYVDNYPITLHKINISGLKIVNEEWVRNLIDAKILKKGPQLVVHQSLLTALTYLRELKAIDNATVVIQVFSVPGRLGMDCDVNIDVTEPKRAILHTGIEMTSEGKSMLGLTGTVRSLFGRCDTTEATASIGLENIKAPSLEAHVRFSKPLPFSSWAESFEVSASTSRIDDSSLTWTRSLLSGFNTSLFSRFGHSFHYDLFWRSTSPSPPLECSEDPSYNAILSSVKPLTGKSIKSALRHCWQYCTHDNPFVPTRGWGIRTCTEIAGLLGSVRFFKHTLSGQYSFPLPLQASLIFGSRVGAIIHSATLGKISEGKSVVSPLDRFVLGGDSLRGFLPGGVNPQCNSKTGNLGGDAFITSSAVLSVPFPRSLLTQKSSPEKEQSQSIEDSPQQQTKKEKQEKQKKEEKQQQKEKEEQEQKEKEKEEQEQPFPLRAHLFASAGNINPVSWSAGLRSSTIINQLQTFVNLRQFRASVGVGCSMAFDSARLECNACLPVRSMPGDRTTRFQLNIATEW